MSDVDNEQNVESNAIEEQALTLNWTPQDEFKGNPDKWVDAETFVKRHNIKQSNNHELKAEVDSLKSQVKDVLRAAQASEAKLLVQHQEELKLERERLLMIKREGITEGDGDKVVEAEEAT